MLERPEPIAIIGLGGVFPGAATPDQFWRNIAAGQDAGRHVPAGRWPIPAESLLAPGIAVPDRLYSSWGCFIDQVVLPEMASGLPVGLLDELDPVFRFGVAAARQAFLDARLDRRPPERAGVILGNIALPTDATSRLSVELLGAGFANAIHNACGNDADRKRASRRFSPTVPALDRRAAGLPTALIAADLGLTHAGWTLDAACASSLYAIKLAVDELRTGRADVMLAGGMSRPSCLYTQMGFAQLQALSRGGRCRPLDAAADGLVVGEGAGVFVLKRLAQAVRDADTIHGVITGIGLSNDRGGTLLAPQSEGQLRAIDAAYRQAGWSPRQIDLVECHATGTAVGDAVEIRSLNEFWSDAPQSAARCVLGAVKSNVGHLLTGAGAAGLMKVLLAMRHAQRPPTANFEQPSQALADGKSFTVLKDAEAWPEPLDHPRRAAVNAFGFGGINAHVLVEQYRESQKSVQVRVPVDVTDERRENEIAIIGLDVRIGNEPYPLDRLIFGDDAGTEATAGDGFRRWGTETSSESPATWQELEVVPGRFRIPPREIQEMLPQQLSALLCADAALHDADIATPLGDRAGVFLGIALDPNTGNFQFRWSVEEELRRQSAVDSGESAEPAGDIIDAAGPPLTANRVMGALGSIAASRIAREFEAGGPSFTVASEETSGLAALKIAVQQLQQGEIDLALVGAVDLTADLRTPAGAAPYGELPPADVSVVLVLERAADARRHNHRIRGLLEHHTDKFLSTGLAKTADATAAARADDSYKLSTIKSTNDGTITIPAPRLNAGAATGLLTVAKAVVALDRGLLPTDSGTSSGNAEYWFHNREDGPRRADVRCEGADGNVHQVRLREPEKSQPPGGNALKPQVDGGPAIIPLTGNSRSELHDRISQLRSRLSGEVATYPQDIAGRWLAECPPIPSAPWRAAVVFASVEQLRRQVDALHEQTLETVEQRRDVIVRHPNGETVFVGEAGASPLGELAFVYPGSGSIYQGMGRELFARWPGILERQDQANFHLKDQFDPERMWDQQRFDELFRNHRFLILSQVAFGTAVADLLGGLGLKANAAIGYSLGESTALFAHRVWTDRDGMLRRMRESELFGVQLPAPFTAARTYWSIPHTEPVDWTCGVVSAPAEQIREAIGTRDDVFLLIINTARQCLIGGRQSAVEQVVAATGSRYFAVPAPSTVHCPILKVVEDDYHTLHRLPTTPSSDTRIYSSGFGHAYEPTEQSAADAIVRQAVDTVDFPQVVNRAYDDGVRTFIEIGPGNSCTRMIDKILGDRPHNCVTMCPGRDSETTSFLEGLARLFVTGHDVDWHAAQVTPPADLSAEATVPPIVVPVAGYGFTVPQPKSERQRQALSALADQLQAPPAQERQTERPRTETVPVAAPPTTAAGTARPRPAERLVTPKSRTPMPVPNPATTPSLRNSPTAPPEAEPMISESTLDAWDASLAAGAEAHATYLEFSNAMTTAIVEQIDALQICDASVTETTTSPEDSVSLAAEIDVPERRVVAIPDQTPTSLDRDRCLEFAIGSIHRALGEQFAEIDKYPTRVRLPDEPLMLVDRILQIEGVPKSMTSGRVVTEHDIHSGAWYLDCNRIPTCIAVESGQADLFLAGYLGIDFQTRGTAVYRLLDAVVAFHDHLPEPGRTIHYDIRIKEFFRQAETILFRFEFDATVDGQPLLTMREGCAGFFSSQELAAGKGIIKTTLDLQPRPGKLPDDWQPLVPMIEEEYDARQIQALRNGDLTACFGSAFADLPLTSPVTLPGGRMTLLHRVTKVDPTGGRFGIGQIQAEADIQPDDWFLTCHFCDDNVMPGTLMYECCLHTLRVYLLRMGWIGEAGRIAYEPVPGINSRLKCRGQVIASTKVAGYEITLKEIGYDPEPYVIADALMSADGKPIVEITDMSVRLTGLTREDVDRLWAGRAIVHDNAPTADIAYDRRPALYDYERILAFATGKPSDAFGDRYRAFDNDRVIARLPGPPFQFLDRITRIDAEPWIMQAGGTIEAQYDVPPDAWYFDANRQPVMPFAVLLETALQPCGWLAAYVGSALTSDQDLSFRNLGGTATQHQAVFPNSGTLTTTVKMTKAANSGGMIIQHYDYEMTCNGEPVYTGDTYFGFFSKESLANQVGIRDADRCPASAANPARHRPIAFPDVAPFPDRRFRMVDHIDLFVPDGGRYGAGFLRGTAKVDPDAWFFKAHFFQDPVWPGSLGLESFVQLLKVFADDRWGRDTSIAPAFDSVALNAPHRWTYRGQVIPRDELVTVEAEIVSVDESRRLVTAKGFLIVDGRVIYEMQDFTLQIRPAPTRNSELQTAAGSATR